MLVLLRQSRTSRRTIFRDSLGRVTTQQKKKEKLRPLLRYNPAGTSMGKSSYLGQIDSQVLLSRPRSAKQTR